MKWGPFIILALIALVLQTSVASWVQIHSVRPDLLLVLAVFYALWGPWPEGAIAAWLLGLLADLHSLDRIGLHALCFGLAALAIVYVRQVVFRDHAVTQIAITFVFAVLVHLLAGAYRSWGGSGEAGVFTPALLTGVYTAIVAPYVHWLLLRLGRWTGLRPSRGSLRPM